MKKALSICILITLTSVIIFSGCTPKAKYDKKLKQELASGIRFDSIFFGLYFGMTQKDFYTRCWELNRQGLVKQGPGNATVEYQIRNELPHPATMNFYPNFIDGRIAELPVKFVYSGWAPWNKNLSADSLQVNVLKWFEKKYGGDFIKVNHRQRGSAFIQLKGNRRITIFRENEMFVWAIFGDMLVLKDENAAKIPQRRTIDTLIINK